MVVKLAVEIMENRPLEGFRRFNLRDELFWFGRPKLLLVLIQLISFQVSEVVITSYVAFSCITK